MALASKIDNSHKRIFVIIGDGESQEGSVWEAAMAAANFNLDNLTVILDHNRVQELGTVKEISGIEDWASKWQSFGWDVESINGHDLNDLYKSFSSKNRENIPKIIIANTIKGKGISIMENNSTGWHYKMPSKRELKVFMKELSISAKGVRIMQKAFLNAIYDLAEKDPNVLLLSADNGTEFDKWFKSDFPEQSIEFGIAECNMVAAAAGLSACGKTPFVHTAGVFLAYRAYEFIRNDVCFQNMNVKIIGFGSGLANSTLGPSHHSTEDIGVLNSLPNLTILSLAVRRKPKKLSNMHTVLMVRFTFVLVYVENQKST